MSDQAGQTLTPSDDWATPHDTVLTILLWAVAVGMVFWRLSHVGQVILLLVISGLIAIALVRFFISTQPNP